MISNHMAPQSSNSIWKKTVASHVATVSAFCNSMQSHLVQYSLTMEYLLNKVPNMRHESKVSNSISFKPNAVIEQSWMMAKSSMIVAVSGSMGNMK